MKRGLGIDVLAAAEARIARVFDEFPRIYLSFSGGKDSTVMLHVAMREAMRRERRIGVLFVDLEAQYRATIEHVQAMFQHYDRWIEPFWVALPLHLRNAVSAIEPHWLCWDARRESDWVRPRNQGSIAVSPWPWFHDGMEFEEFVPQFGWWYGHGELTACLVGIRADESLNRFRTVAARTKAMYQDEPWTTHVGRGVYNVYPIYDWRTPDIWTYHGRMGLPYNTLYDSMYQAGLSIHEMRICQPYGDDQRKGLWLFQVIEPETWARVVARVCGANAGALYARTSGNVLGRLKISCPPGHTWKSFATVLLHSLPPATAEHYKTKIAVFIRWWMRRGYPAGIPDERPLADEASKQVPSWRRICKVLLRHDYWCKGLSFTQHRSESYARYLALMKRRRAEWGLMP